MSKKTTQESSKLTQALYQITVVGTLKEDWRDWFNGMLIGTEGLSKGNSSTTLTCKVRDQAELIGIINWLHNMNMVIDMVCLVQKSNERERKEEI